MTAARARKPLGEIVAAIGADIRHEQALYREAMRQRVHDYDGDPATGLCGHCCAGEIYWVHVGPPTADR